jgi:Domain of unknown function (DUF4252)
MTNRMTNKMQLVLAMAMAACFTANAQQMAIQPAVKVPAVDLQTSSTVQKDDLFAGTEKFAQGASEVTEINLDPTKMGLIGKTKDKDAPLARKMAYMVIHTYKYDKPDMYKMDDVEAYRKKLTDGSWNCYIHVRKKNESTDICARITGDFSEKVILTAKPQELTFIHTSGNMSLEELGRAGTTTREMARP